ncbi:MAG: hypothetical protein HQL83_11825 [Magnetococcales bacterium]|nr:hypothetical protein [Magnetococcales bacterium]
MATNNMTDLAEQLNNEHIDIIDKYWSAFSFGVTSSEGQAIMRKALNAFFSHIFREEHELCQILLAAAEKNAQIASSLSQLNRDVLSLTKVIIDSFGEFMSSYNAETRYYYRQIMYTILNRVSVEEHWLTRYNQVFNLFTPTQAQTRH